MLEFKTPEDLSKLSPDDPAFPIVEDLVKRLITDYIAEGYDYIPDDDGYTILVEPEDADRELIELWDGCRLTNIMYEGIKSGQMLLFATHNPLVVGSSPTGPTIHTNVL